LQILIEFILQRVEITDFLDKQARASTALRSWCTAVRRIALDQAMSSISD
jgi:hypothetical protein